MLTNYWGIIEEVYSKLVDGKFNINDQIKLTNKNSYQSFDIWFEEPFSFAVEFDESQHLNQFRQRTLNSYSLFQNSIDLDLYKTITNKDKKPGNSGFHKLASHDPLFPEMYEGEKQDNRIRQRAFRDFLKDIIPNAIGINPTIRLPYHITNRKIKSFNDSDLKAIREYLIKKELIKKIKL